MYNIRNTKSLAKHTTCKAHHTEDIHSITSQHQMVPGYAGTQGEVVWQDAQTHKQKMTHNKHKLGHIAQAQRILHDAREGVAHIKALGAEHRESDGVAPAADPAYKCKYA